MSDLMRAVKSNNVKAARVLIDKGADVNAIEANGDAPLVMAAYLGHTDVVRMLLDAGALVSAVDPEMKATALHAAAYAGRTEAAKLLIEHGIDINRQGPVNGYTALHDAIWQNNIDTAQAIVDAGADLTLKTHEGKTPLEFAREKNRREIVKIIEAKTRRPGA
jgi:uncharacterized protein